MVVSKVRETDRTPGRKRFGQRRSVKRFPQGPAILASSPQRGTAVLLAQRHGRPGKKPNERHERIWQ